MYDEIKLGQVIKMAFIELNNVQKRYQMGEVTITALDGVDFTIEKGDSAVVVGESGAGKTTVLNLLGGMDSSDGGTIIVDQKKIHGYNDNLVQNLTAVENVELASQISKDPLDAMEVLDMVGLKDRADNFPSQLSGGEQQRVAIARAIAKNPKLLLCDEPTGALDYQTGKNILKLLHDTSRERGVTVVVITHNAALTAMADKVIRMKSGKVTDFHVNENPESVERIEY